HTSKLDRPAKISRHGLRLACSALFVVPLFILWVLLATDDDGNIALVHNDVVQDAQGHRLWLGSMGNTTDSQYRAIAVTIQFLDSDDQPVGQVQGQANILEPGESFDLQSSLPDDAVALRVYSLEWVTGRHNKRTDPPLGPWAPWPFGHVQTDWPRN
ncbi:MAG: FxLYD domain-containing protein, partial [Pseudomonadota bacterium]